MKVLEDTEGVLDGPAPDLSRSNWLKPPLMQKCFVGQNHFNV